MNGIDIVYFKDENFYALACIFENYEAECKYLKNLLKLFTKYMDENGLNKNEPFRLQTNSPATTIEAETIEELYTNFKIFVYDFCFLDKEIEEEI